MNEAEEDGTRERAEDNAGGVRVELGVRRLEEGILRMCTGSNARVFINVAYRKEI
jgi:hypothetical protein